MRKYKIQNLKRKLFADRPKTTKLVFKYFQVPCDIPGVVAFEVGQRRVDITEQEYPGGNDG